MVLERLRASRVTAVETEPEPAPVEIRVLCDGSGDLRTIPYSEWPAYQARGYKTVPPGMVPRDRNGVEIVPADPNVEPSRDIFAPIARMAVETQGHVWSAREQLASEALDRAGAVIAERINRPVVDRASLGHAATVAHPVHSADLLQYAYMAEAICSLAAELDTLKRELAISRANTGEG